MNGDDKKRILNSSDKGLGKTELNIPAQLFRKMLVKLNIDGRAYDRLIRAYLERTSSSKDPVTLASDRGNLNKALLDNKISWKTFIRGIEMIGAVNLRVTIDVQLPTKKWVSVESDLYPLIKTGVPIQDQKALDLDSTEASDD